MLGVVDVGGQRQDDIKDAIVARLLPYKNIHIINIAIPKRPITKNIKTQKHLTLPISHRPPIITIHLPKIAQPHKITPIKNGHSLPLKPIPTFNPPLKTIINIGLTT